MVIVADVDVACFESLGHQQKAARQLGSWQRHSSQTMREIIDHAINKEIENNTLEIVSERLLIFKMSGHLASSLGKLL